VLLRRSYGDVERTECGSAAAAPVSDTTLVTVFVHELMTSVARQKELQWSNAILQYCMHIGCLATCPHCCHSVVACQDTRLSVTLWHIQHLRKTLTYLLPFFTKSFQYIYCSSHTYDIATVSVWFCQVCASRDVKCSDILLDGEAKARHPRRQANTSI